MDRLGTVLAETGTPCFAWALIPNHVHLLLKTGLIPISTVMRRLLTGHAAYFNRRHRRHGKLFQNRYKSILCQEDAYLLEFVRYIHLNPIRSRLVLDLKSLEKWAYSKHSTIVGNRETSWQDSEYVLELAESLKMSQPSVSQAVRRGEQLCKEKRWRLIEGKIINQ